jgi:O-antigen/teichoic acid export membrane protein
LKHFVIIGLLRLATGAAQFGIIVFLTIYLSLNSLGVYALFTVALSYLSQLAGFSFNTYLQREVSSRPPVQWPGLLLQQWRFLAVSLGAAFAITVVIFGFGFIPFEYVAQFFGILLMTVLNGQIENFMVGIGRPVSATINLLLRSAWILPLFLYTVWRTPGVTLYAVFTAWFLAELFALSAILERLRRLGLLPTRWEPTDKPWILSGVKVGAQYTAWALLLLFIVNVQRIVLGHTHSEEQVGIFHFFFVISVFVPNLLEASLYAVIIPKLLVRHHTTSDLSLRFPDRIPFLILLGGGGICLLLVAVVLPVVLGFFGKVELLEHRQVFYYTAAYALLYTASRVFHYQLYASRRDRTLGVAYIRAAVVAGVASWLLIPRWGLHGASQALVCAGLALALSCAWPFIGGKAA